MKNYFITRNGVLLTLFMFPVFLVTEKELFGAFFETWILFLCVWLIDVTRKA